LALYSARGENRNTPGRHQRIQEGKLEVVREASKKSKGIVGFCPAALSSSVRVLVREPANERKNDNLKIESECPVVEIIKVVLDTFLN
jgi:hypothetical protein